jgi:hypothetical protein
LVLAFEEGVFLREKGGGSEEGVVGHPSARLGGGLEWEIYIILGKRVYYGEEFFDDGFVTGEGC